jgi:hypothetical protein
MVSELVSKLVAISREYNTTQANSKAKDAKANSKAKDAKERRKSTGAAAVSIAQRSNLVLCQLFDHKVT